MSYFIVCTRVYGDDENFKLYVYCVHISLDLTHTHTHTHIYIYIYKQEWDFPFELIVYSVVYTLPLISHIYKQE